MRRVVLMMSVSVDGFVAGPHGHAGGFPETDQLKRWKLDRIRRAGTHIMGRVTYEEMAAHWPTSTDDYADPPASTWRRDYCLGRRQLRPVAFQSRTHRRICAGDSPRGVRERPADVSRPIGAGATRTAGGRDIRQQHRAPRLQAEVISRSHRILRVDARARDRPPRALDAKAGLPGC